MLDRVNADGYMNIDILFGSKRKSGVHHSWHNISINLSFFYIGMLFESKRQLGEHNSWHDIPINLSLSLL